MRIDKLIGVEKIDYVAREVVMNELKEFRLIGVEKKITIKTTRAQTQREEIHQSSNNQLDVPV